MPISPAATYCLAYCTLQPCPLCLLLADGPTGSSSAPAGWAMEQPPSQRKPAPLLRQLARQSRQGERPRRRRPASATLLRKSPACGSPMSGRPRRRMRRARISPRTVPAAAATAAARAAGGRHAATGLTLLTAWTRHQSPGCLLLVWCDKLPSRWRLERQPCSLQVVTGGMPPQLRSRTEGHAG